MAFAGVWNEGSWTKDAALLPARLALGSTMLYHGTSKLRGDGPEQTGQMFHGMGLKPGKFWATATGIAETFAGAAAILGIATRPAALAVLVTQAVAITKVHAPKGFDVMKGGFEYNLALMGIAAALLLAGPGRVSAHEALETAARGKGGKRLWRAARPGPALRAILLVK